MCFASLVSGALVGKVRSIVCSQVATNPIPSHINKLKAGIHFPSTLDALGVDGITADTDDYVSLTERIFNNSTKGLSKVILPYDE